MAQKIVMLLSSYELRERFGRCALQKLREKFTMELAAPKIVRVMQRFLPVPLSPNGTIRRSWIGQTRRLPENSILGDLAIVNSTTYEVKKAE